MMAADVSQQGNELLVPSPTPFIDDWTYGSSDPSRFHDVLADGAFLVDDRSGDFAARERFRVEELHVILNFLDQVKERVGG